MRGESWRQILDGDLAARALAAASDIADALTSRYDDASLGRGKAGIAVFHAAFGDAFGRPDATERAVALLDEAIDDVASAARMDASIYGTIVGVAWAASRVGTLTGALDDEEHDIDRLVARLVSQPRWPGHFDLVTGLAGLGTYALERLPRASANATLEDVVRHLAALAEQDGRGLTWRTTPGRYAPRSDLYPGGHYDLGMAHGVAGLVAFLAAATSAGVAAAKPLLDGAASWLAVQGVLRSGDKGRFPGVLAPDGTASPARMAWCYGDPGVAVALLAAGEALGDGALVGLAGDVARGCVGRVESSGVVEAGLCHGAAGLGHIFNRIGQALGDEALLDLARFWFGYALDLRGAADGVAGFPGDPTDPAGRASASFLQGVAGTGVALLAAALPVPPWWDAVLCPAWRPA